MSALGVANLVIGLVLLVHAHYATRWWKVAFTVTGVANMLFGSGSDREDRVRALWMLWIDGPALLLGWVDRHLSDPMRWMRFH